MLLLPTGFVASTGETDLPLSQVAANHEEVAGCVHAGVGLAAAFRRARGEGGAAGQAAYAAAFARRLFPRAPTGTPAPAATQGERLVRTSAIFGWRAALLVSTDEFEQDHRCEQVRMSATATQLCRQALLDDVAAFESLAVLLGLRQLATGTFHTQSRLPICVYKLWKDCDP